MTIRALRRDGLDTLLADPAVSHVLSVLKGDGEETRIVGGSVRDALLGQVGADIDLATTLLPQDVMRRATAASLKAIPTGIEHGTVTILADGRAFEVTTLREDVETDGRHAVVRFGRDFARDAERRDFTINALSLSRDGVLHDTTGGEADLHGGRVRFIGDAATRIREDALRILRFFRFHARYGIGAPDKDGLRAATDAGTALDGLSRERVRSELLKLLDAPGVIAAVLEMRKAGLLSRIIGTEGYLDRLERALSASANDASPLEPVARLATLAVDSNADAERLRWALRLSNEEHACLQAYAAARRAIERLPVIAATDVVRLVATQDLESLGLAIAVLDDHYKKLIDPEARSVLQQFIDGNRSVPVFPLSGSDLVAAGIPPGRSVGQGLAAGRSLWLKRGCQSGQEERALLLDHAVTIARSKA
ncbi:CCA tRNA nucleotidyltransferase [Methylobacterium sp. E-045]|uniref:CCA tRNA nucleotidyltransferase n=1 Tax=Methylobacterium sp. E-045 TaxID=2836575 RepID=UPI001FB8B396|nr:CCA tRNA nucleotidyltransferase [Methylobacterium sp. E-045]MCJ2129041.1 CCA tRNA nucleotidyltransferase [Methylobacterium sp. E-045]